MKMKKNKIKIKKLLKIIGIILGIIAVLFLLSKIYCFVVFAKVYEAVEDFRLEKNRYYAVEVERGDFSYRGEIFLRENVIKYLKFKNASGLYYEWKDIGKDKQYTINAGEKKIYENELYFYEEKSLPCMPRILLLTQNNIQSKIAKAFEIHYILLVKYENIKCYKIVTDTETIMIDRKTYLPVYSSKKVMNQEKSKRAKVEMKYEFEVGNVTEEDVALPDLSDYTVVEIKENK